MTGTEKVPLFVMCEVKTNFVSVTTQEDRDEPALRPSTDDLLKAIDVMRSWIEMMENTGDPVPGLQRIERRVAAGDLQSSKVV